MPEHVNVPTMLLNKIKVDCPPIYALLLKLEAARAKGDQQKQKQLRSALRKKGFYLSRLEEGEDPFVHWSICNSKETPLDEDPEDALLTENQVVALLSSWLQKNGWDIISQCIGHQQGIDILAISGTQTLIVEAKGARGNKNSPVTKRTKFSTGQLRTHFGRALVKCLEEKHDNLSAITAIAQPDTLHIRHCLGPAVHEAKKIGIRFYWVGADGSVEVE